MCATRFFVQREARLLPISSLLLGIAYARLKLLFSYAGYFFCSRRGPFPGRLHLDLIVFLLSVTELLHTNLALKVVHGFWPIPAHPVV